jgi:predicted ATPase/DNA-binding XRE family transcriptional regulator
MALAATQTFGARLKALREAAGFTQEELATIAGLSVHAVSALERGERRKPQFETVRSLSMALELGDETREALLASARGANRADNPDAAAPALPLPLTALVGRDDDVVLLREYLTDGAVRIVTLVGPGGVGKTRLALELARTTLEAGTVRVVFVPLAAIHDPVLVASAIAEAFGVGDPSSLDLPRRVAAACDGQPTLLVLDNFEQVLAAAPLVAALIATVPGLRVLVTSRAPLHLRGEREHVVTPLRAAPAVRLFLERIRDVQADYQLTPADEPIVAAICRRLDALPLALELAAPWIKVLTASGLLAKLDREGRLTGAGPRDLPERQQTMNATVAWSYDLLDPVEQRAFRRLGALPGLFPIDAAAETLSGAVRAGDHDEALAAVAALIDKSLLVRSEASVVPTCPLYYMLETVRAYAEHELETAAERDDAMEGLVRYCLTEAALAAAGLEGPSQLEWLDRVREDLDSYRAALTWLIAKDRSEEAARIAWALFFFWLIRGHATEGLRWYEQILSRPSIRPADEVTMRLGAAGMLHTQGALDRARAELTRVLDLPGDTGAADMRPRTAWMFGHVEYAAGNLAASRDWFTRCRDGFAGTAVPWGHGNALSGLAWVALAEGDRDRAGLLVGEAWRALELAGEWFLALPIYIRVVLALQSGNADGVIALMRQSLVRVRESKDSFGVVYGLVPLAAAAALKGDHEWVARIFGMRDAITARTGVVLIDPLMRELSERTERDARAQLGPARWGDAHAVGRHGSIDRMLQDIDRARGVASAVE